MSTTEQARFDWEVIDRHLDRLVSHIERTDLTNRESCWKFNGFHNASGDARFMLGARNVSVRQLCYWIELGEWEPGNLDGLKRVRIKPACDFAECVNPYHMELVATQKECDIADCSNESVTRGYCHKHVKRLYRHNDPLIVLVGELSPKWKGTECSYPTAHQRLRHSRGKASDYTCVDCGNPAHEWSYTRGDGLERKSPRGPYSSNPDSYVARCRPCHRKLDAIGRKKPVKRTASEAA